MPQPDNSFIGDVKYSIIEPVIYLQEHPGWILLEGQDIDVDTALGKLGITRLPDARGMFIRGMNIGRQKADGDSDGDRSVGSQQTDTFRMHGHSINNGVIGWGNIGNGHPWRIVSDDGPSWNETNIIMTAQPFGGDETRPKNIALYVYIKIN